jgi:pentatricopeptide repeat protein
VQPPRAATVMPPPAQPDHEQPQPQPHHETLPIHRLLELIKSDPDPAAALAHLERLVATWPAYTPPQPLLFHLLRRLATASPSRLPRLLGLLPNLRHRPRFSESAALVVLSAFSRALMPDAALAAFRRLPAFLGCNPGVRSHNALLDAFVRARCFSDADAFFASLSHGAFGRRIAPNLQTYNIILRSLCSRGDLDRALALFDSLRRRHVVEG